MFRCDRSQPTVGPRFYHLEERHRLVGSFGYGIRVVSIAEQLNIFVYRPADVGNDLPFRFSVAVGEWE